jgi:ectoine hydroxylase-related dioxygenase (phytanoyl-CoA dioxygenase family)
MAMRLVLSNAVKRPIEDGFEIIPGMISEQEISELSRGLAHLGLERSRAGSRHLLRFPVVQSLACDPRLIEIATTALGKPARAFNATLFDKGPNANWLVVWHQDTALPLRERRDVPGWGPWSVKAGVLYAHAPAVALDRVVALRIHLDDSTGLNGPLRVLPGSHTRGVLTDDQIAGLARTVSSAECLVARGGVVLMKPLVVHSSSKATNSSARRVIHIEYTDRFNQDDGLEIADLSATSSSRF